MKIKTITCHNVYNAGASLQAYALATYLRQLGHDAQIIDYIPDYLVHYRLTGVANSAYNKPVLRELYNLMKLPGRLAARYGQRKRNFDRFTFQYLPLTKTRYSSFEDLLANPPEADVYIAGSDQIWNTFFQNGRDPAFYLRFAPEGRIRASYAASFATEQIAEQGKEQIKVWLADMDHISVRETSGIKILEDLGIDTGQSVLDPVFLLPREQWDLLCGNWMPAEPYVLVYDFDNNDKIRRTAEALAAARGWKIYTLFKKLGYGDKCMESAGPVEFLELIRGASYVLSNSFHATAFSLIFQRPFLVFDRSEGINTRMRDLLQSIGLLDRLVSGENAAPSFDVIDYCAVCEDLAAMEIKSKGYIDRVLSGENYDR